MEHNLCDLELDELLKLRDSMLNQARGPLSCQDGSYECALDSYGFNAVVREISVRVGLLQS